MDTSGDEIRRLAESMQITERESAAQRAWTQGDVEHRIQEQWLEEERRRLIIPLCGKFVVWANNHDIPYDSPSYLAQGWLLGRREGPPSCSISHQGIQSSGSSEYSLLVKRSGNIRELVVDNVTKRGRRYHLFHKPGAPQYRRYTVASVQKSIAKFSVLHGVEWEE